MGGRGAGEGTREDGEPVGLPDHGHGDGSSGNGPLLAGGLQAELPGLGGDKQ